MHSRILFIGNGVNLVAGRNEKYSWNKILEDMEGKLLPEKCRDVTKSGGYKKIGFVARYQRVLNYLLMHPHKKELEEISTKFIKELQGLKPTFVHYLLAEMVGKSEEKKFDTILTTNYDFAMEKSLWPKFKASKDAKDSCEKEEVSIYHIHGSARKSEDKDEPIVISAQSYRKKLGEIQQGCEWLEKFCENEVHICGFGMGQEEAIFWYALEERLKRLRDKEALKHYSNRVYAYLFFTDENKDEQKELGDLLRSYAVNVIYIPVSGGDYRHAWLTLIGRMRMVLQNYRFRRENGEVLGGSKSVVVESRGKNISTAYISSCQVSDYCLMRVPEKKLKKADVWGFYCEIETECSMWKCSPKVFRKAKHCRRLESDDLCYQVYLDFYTGELFTAPESEGNWDKLIKLGQCEKVESLAEFEKLIEESSKTESKVN